MKQLKFTLRRIGDMAPLVNWITKHDFAKPIQVTVGNVDNKNSNAQKATYFMMCSDVGKDTGNSKDDMDEYFKIKFCPPRVTTVGDETFTVYSLKGLSTTEMKDFYDQSYACAATEFGVIARHPDDAGR